MSNPGLPRFARQTRRLAMTISQTNIDRLPEALIAVGDSSYGPIIRVEEERRLEAVNRLLAVNGDVDGVRSERFLAFSRSQHVRLDAMWSRLDEQQRIVHTVLAVPNAGRTAMVFASQARRRQEIPAIAELIDHACTMIGQEGVRLGQTLLDPTESMEREVFLAGGFTELARLRYMERPLPNRRAPRHIQWPAGVTVEPYRDEARDALLTILDASYEDTHDCPGLRGLRDTPDILAGHMATGEFDPQLWTLLRVDGRPAGALLLNPTPQHRSVELVYIGLAKFARGRGLARLLLQHGLSLLAGRSERIVSLAVDDRNAAALALYRGAGFHRKLTRLAVIRRTAARTNPS